MVTQKQVLKNGAAILISSFRDVIKEQGHTLTGALENSAKAVYNVNSIDVEVLDYIEFVNNGYPASSASYKQVPFLIDFFKKRGKSESEAKRFAFATVKVWQKEGMPTNASKRFSSTRKRRLQIQIAFVRKEKALDNSMLEGMDLLFNQKFHETKSETI